MWGMLQKKFLQHRSYCRKFCNGDDVAETPPPLPARVAAAPPSFAAAVLQHRCCCRSSSQQQHPLALATPIVSPSEKLWTSGEQHQRPLVSLAQPCWAAGGGGRRREIILDKISVDSGGGVGTGHGATGNQRKGIWPLVASRGLSGAWPHMGCVAREGGGRRFVCFQPAEPNRFPFFFYYRALLSTLLPHRHTWVPCYSASLSSIGQRQRN